MNNTILIIGKLPPPMTGTSMWATTLIRGSSWVRFRPEVFNINVNKDVLGIGVMSVSKFIRTANLFCSFIGMVRRTRPVLVIVPISQTIHVFFRDMIFVLLSRLMGHPVLLYLHGSAFRDRVIEQYPYFRSLIIYLFRRTAGVVVLGENLRGIFAELFEDDHVYVIPNGIDIPYCDRTCIYRQVIFLGNIMVAKGVEDFLIASTHVHELRPDIRFVIVGQMGDAQSVDILGDFVKRSDIVYMGALYGEEKIEVLSQSDILVFPPRANEGHPIVLIEALGSGLAQIATDKGAIIETVIDGETGYIVPDSSPKAIAERILYLYDHPEVLRAMQLASRKRYERQFTAAAMVEGIERTAMCVLQEEEI